MGPPYIVQRTASFQSNSVVPQKKLIKRSHVLYMTIEGSTFRISIRPVPDNTICGTLLITYRVFIETFIAYTFCYGNVCMCVRILRNNYTTLKHT